MTQVELMTELVSEAYQNKDKEPERYELLKSIGKIVCYYEDRVNEDDREKLATVASKILEGRVLHIRRSDEKHFVFSVYDDAEYKFPLIVNVKKIDTDYIVTDYEIR